MHGRVKPWLYQAFPETWVSQVFPSMAKTGVDLCVEKYNPTCLNISEWAVHGDYELRLQDCIAVPQRSEPKSIKVGIHPD